MPLNLSFYVNKKLSNFNVKFSLTRSLTKMLLKHVKRQVCPIILEYFFVMRCFVVFPAALFPYTSSY